MEKGIVSHDATIVDPARIGRYARVLGYATVRHLVTVEDFATVGGYAQLNDRCRLAGQSTVKGHAILLRDVWVMGKSLVEGDAVLDGCIFLCDTHIAGDVHLISGTMEVNIENMHWWTDIP